MGTVFKLIATSFYIGKSPIAPGTVASLFAAIIGFIAIPHVNYGTLIVFLLSLFIIGTYSTFKVLTISEDPDPSYIVIDEVLGQLIALSFCSITLTNTFLAFAFFRLFDIFKPWPISVLDKPSQNRHIQPILVMADDILAGIFSGFCVYIISKLTKI